MSAYRLPKACISEIDRILCCFPVVCKPKEEGGLGLRPLCLANKVSCHKGDKFKASFSTKHTCALIRVAQPGYMVLLCYAQVLIHLSSVEIWRAVIISVSKETCLSSNNLLDLEGKKWTTSWGATHAFLLPEATYRQTSSQ
ncbi:unnamed protein product [Microthlaspi erraticum]|uniref:Uncharacterized protein n=1 Tax=Microthlaspi erraticum TaxID=1685480 RepID=A0A6D2K9M7_9BRAS|nr:unnamed protein product [Microthlaspi erraticum]